MVQVLVVDDSDDMRKLASELFKKAGAEVEEFDSPMKALQAMTDALDKEKPYDLVLTDIVMPAMNGFELAEEMRGIGFDGPIVAFTATANGFGKRDGEKAGITSYLSKETMRLELIEALLSSYCLGK